MLNQKTLCKLVVSKTFFSGLIMLQRGTPWQKQLHKATRDRSFSGLQVPADPTCRAALRCTLLLAGRNENRDTQPTGTLLPTAATEKPVPEHLRRVGGQSFSLLLQLMCKVATSQRKPAWGQLILRT